MPTSIQQWFNDMSVPRRASLMVLGVLVVIVPLVALSIVSRDVYKPLVTDIPPADMAQIVDLVEQQGVSYHLNGSGTSIEIPEADLAAMRMQLASANLPGYGHVGFEIFADSDYGRSDFSQKVNYMRAMQGELARTIMALPQVKDARVHLVMPEKSLFQSEKSRPSASITLIEASEGAVGQNQVAGIQKLVSAAIRDMTPGDVVVLTGQGVTLSADNGAELPASVKLKSAAEEIEESIERKAARVLQPFLRNKEFAISATVELGYDKYRVRLEEPVTGDGELLIKSQKIRLQTDKADMKSRTAGSDKSTRDEETTYALGSRVEEREVDKQVIQRISVALVLPAGVGQAERQQAAELVRHAAGLDPSRGDEVYVSLMGAIEDVPLDEPEAAPEAPRTYAHDWRLTALIAGGIFLVALVVGRVLPRRERLREQDARELARRLEQWLSNQSGGAHD